MATHCNYKMNSHATKSPRCQTSACLLSSIKLQLRAISSYSRKLSQAPCRFSHPFPWNPFQPFSVSLNHVSSETFTVVYSWYRSPNTIITHILMWIIDYYSRCIFCTGILFEFDCLSCKDCVSVYVQGSADGANWHFQTGWTCVSYSDLTYIYI